MDSARPHDNADPRRWFGFAVLLFAGFMDLLDGTIVFVALPRIAADLGASYASLEWVVAGYTLAFALALITGGRLGDIHGRRRIFLIGVAGFTVASVAAGLAPTAEVLIGARAVQGVMAAVMVPQVLSIAQVVFPPRERFAAFALYGIVLSLAAVVGPLLGGLLTELDIAGLGWRPIFLINLPLGLFTLVAAARLVPESRSSHALRLDLVGVGLVTAALLLLLYPLVEGRSLGWPAWTFASMAASLPVFALFARWERRRARHDGSPLTEPSLFGQRSFVAGLALSLILFSGLASFWFVLVLWLQVGLGFSPLMTALAGVAWPLAVMASGAAGAKLAGSVGRKLLNVGLGLMALGVAGVIGTIGLVGQSIEPWQLAPALAVGGIGMGITMPSLFDFILAAVPPRHAGSASGVVNTVVQLGSATGIAVVGLIFFGLVDASGAPPAESFTAGLESTLWFHVAAFGTSALLAFLLPRRPAAHDPEAVWSPAPPSPESRGRPPGADHDAAAGHGSLVTGGSSAGPLSARALVGLRLWRMSPIVARRSPWPSCRSSRRRRCTHTGCSSSSASAARTRSSMSASGQAFTRRSSDSTDRGWSPSGRPAGTRTGRSGPCTS
jgi:EmrB/QacA subfamily drug resistance transporter